jgi:tetraacyldisaccharide 4'-kinase
VKPHPLLFPFSLVYGFVVVVRNWFFDVGIFKSEDVGVPVISVGNITAGGTGKTPMVIQIGNLLLESGKKVAVVSRGYGRNTSGTLVVCDGTTLLGNALSSGDEPTFIAQKLPGAVMIVDEQRVRAAKKAVKEFGCEVIILDDGFQHRQIKRNLDIVLMDKNSLPFNTMMIPAGFRREPLSSLRRANAMVLTKVTNDWNTEIIFNDPRLYQIKNKFSSSYQPEGIKHIFGNVKQSLEMIKGRSVTAFSGIAKPESFHRNIELAGGKIKKTFVFRDHHIYTASNIRSILKEFSDNNTELILTTEKDAVKLIKFREELKAVPIFSLMMNLKIHQQEQWQKTIFDATI